MKNRRIMFRICAMAIIASFMFINLSCSDDDETKPDNGHSIEYGTVTDIDGNEYVTVILGDQEWMTENLRTTKYSDGSLIYYLEDNTEWSNTKSGAMAVYPHDGGVHEDDIEGIESDEEMADAYGKLYNWYAVDDTRGLCPAGWVAPSDDDWTQLREYLIDNYDDIKPDNIGQALKSCRQVESPEGGNCDTEEHPRWNISDEAFGKDIFGFSALPSGYRYPNGAYYHIGDYAKFWTADETATSGFARRRYIRRGSNKLYEGVDMNNNGFSVRCIKD